MNVHRLGFSLVLTLTASLAATPQARAAHDMAKQREARKACLSGNFQKGVEILADLFITTEDPIFIYNQGRCLEQNGRFEDAIYRFHEYLRKATNADASDKADAEKHIADCQALLDKKTTHQAGATMEPAPAQKSMTSSPTPEPASRLASASAPVLGAPSSALDLSAQPGPNEPPRQSAPFYRAWWFWTGTAVVAAGVVTAVILATRGTNSNVPTTPLGNQGALQ